MDKVVNGATFSFPVKDGYKDKLEGLLKEMKTGDDVATNSLFPMGEVASLHYASWIVVKHEQTTGRRNLPPCLLLVTTYNGPVRKHIAELASVAPVGLHRILLCCKEYEEKEPSVRVHRKYLKSHKQISFTYNGYQYTNKQEILREGVMHDRIEDYIDKLLHEKRASPGNPVTAGEWRKKIQEFVCSDPELHWARKPLKTGLQSYLKLNQGWMRILAGLLTVLVSSILFIFSFAKIIHIALGVLIAGILVVALAYLLRPKPKRISEKCKENRAEWRKARRKARRKLKFIVPAILVTFMFMIGASVVAIIYGKGFYFWVAVLFISLLGILIAMILILRLDERNVETHDSPDDNHIKKLTDTERYPVTNEMNVIGPMKEGRIHPFFYSFILWMARQIRSFSYIPTVQTSRWLQIDKGWRLVFIAAFDNTSEGYANDFVDSPPYIMRVNLMFGHGWGFPGTKWTLGAGGKDRKGYMDAVRRQGKLTNAWYDSHPALSIMNIRNNRKIRKGLFGKMDEEETINWLRLF